MSLIPFKVLLSLNLDATEDVLITKHAVQDPVLSSPLPIFFPFQFWEFFPPASPVNSTCLCLEVRSYRDLVSDFPSSSLPLLSQAALHFYSAKLTLQSKFSSFITYSVAKLLSARRYRISQQQSLSLSSRAGLLSCFQYSFTCFRPCLDIE